MAWLKSFLAWLWNSLVAWSAALFENALSALTALFDLCGVDFTPFRPYLEAANYWLPVGEVMTLLTVYIAFRVVYYIVKIIIKLIPWAIG